MEPVTTITLAVATSQALSETTIPALDVANMSPLQLILSAVLILAGLALRIWMKVNSARLSNEELTRGKSLADMATAAAAEVGSREKMNGAQRLSFAQDIVQAGIPKATPEFRDALIHGSLAIMNLGNSGASDIRKPGNDPNSPAQ